MEEVKKEEQTTIGDCCVCAHLEEDLSEFECETSQQEQKSTPYGAKGVRVEESNKEYTGDALALGGDEGRDKLR